MWLNYKIDITKFYKWMSQNCTDGWEKNILMDVTKLFKWKWQGY